MEHDATGGILWHCFCNRCLSWKEFEVLALLLKIKYNPIIEHRIVELFQLLKNRIEFKTNFLCFVWDLGCVLPACCQQVKIKVSKLIVYVLSYIWWHHNIVCTFFSIFCRIIDSFLSLKHNNTFRSNWKWLMKRYRRFWTSE